MKKLENNKSFGLLFFIVFLIIAVWPILNDNSIRVWSIITSLIFLILGVLNSKILTLPKILWIKLGLILGKIVAPIIMGIIYFFVITPIGLLMRLIGKDLLNLKFNKNKTYWIKRANKLNTMKRQF
tara:strand:- start:283 stop:660 length:378 start_codon:yes stop_codon:yes gene_type:complete